MAQPLPAFTRFVSKIVGLTDTDVSQLIANPKNWRVHPLEQQEALAATVQEIGYIAPITINEVTGNMVDGHLRAILAMRGGVERLPALTVHLTPEEEDIALATLDPISAFAASDRSKQQELMESIQSDSEEINRLMQHISLREGIVIGEMDNFDEFSRAAPTDFSYQVVIRGLNRADAEQLASTLENAKVEKYRASK